MVTLVMALVLAVEPARLPQQAPPLIAKVHITDGDARSVHLWCSAGNISEALNLGGGRWEAIYTAPSTGRPQFAVIGAWDDESGHAAAAAISLEGRTEFPAETDPGAQVMVQVGSHRGTGHADSNGQAHVTTLVAPEARVARITAVDPAGNTTVEEVKLDPAPGGVWLVAPPEIAEGKSARVYAFASNDAEIKLRARAGELEIVESGPGFVSAKVSAHADVHLSASGDPGHASATLRYRPAPPPPPVPPPPAPPPPPPPPPRLIEPRWEIGATVGARFSGELAGVGGSVEYRRRVRASRWHLGVDLFGLYATGNARSTDVSAGAAGARAVAELRLSLAPQVAVVFEGAAGGAWVYERRVPTLGEKRKLSDGAPTLALGIGMVARAGRGLFVLRIEYAWTPLVRLGLANLDGGMITAGYRYARW